MDAAAAAITSCNCAPWVRLTCALRHEPDPCQSFCCDAFHRCPRGAYLGNNDDGRAKALLALGAVGLGALTAPVPTSAMLAAYASYFFLTPGGPWQTLSTVLSKNESLAARRSADAASGVSKL